MNDSAVMQIFVTNLIHSHNFWTEFSSTGSHSFFQNTWQLNTFEIFNIFGGLFKNLIDGEENLDDAEKIYRYLIKKQNLKTKKEKLKFASFVVQMENK